MVLGIDDAVLHWTSLALLVAAIVLSFVVVTRFSEERRLIAPFRERFFLGVPWGTVIVIVSVYAFYHHVQGGGEPGGPIIVGFRSWSLWYPQSILFSSFSHASDSHLISNLLGTLAFAPIVEYAWSHYPKQRGTQSFSSWRTNPFVRIGMFVFAVFVIGIAGSLFVPGAVIGFSGVVFAFAGFGLVARPLATVLAILAIRVVGLVRQAFLSPVFQAEAKTRFFSPSWAQTALQGHLFGMLVGVFLAAALIRYRNESPKLRYIWFAALVFAVTRSMYAIYWYQSETEFVQFRGIGTAGVIVLASLVALVALERDRSLISRLDLSVRKVAVAVLLAVLVTLALVAIPYNLVTVSPGQELDEGIDVNDYTVTYAENVENRYVGSVEVPVVGGAPSVSVSGVIVASDQRNAWEIATSKGRLAFDGQTFIPVGDATWRELVVVERTEWKLTGGNATYKIFGREVGNENRLLFSADQAEAAPTINGSRVSIQPTSEFYEIVVEQNDSVLGTARIPSHNESVEIADITFERDEKTLRARYDQTVLEIAEYLPDGRNPDNRNG